jgi:hypothetical protein
VFASVANYFVQKGGWVRGQPVMVRAAYTPGVVALVDSDGDPIHPLVTLEQAGYRPLSPVPAEITAAPIVLDGEAGDEYWLTFRNFRAIWSYNNSIRYATAVYQLAEAIAGRDGAVSTSVAGATVTPVPVQDAPAAPVETAPAQTQPAEAKPAETKPVEPTPAPVTPVQPTGQPGA